MPLARNVRDIPSPTHDARPDRRRQLRAARRHLPELQRLIRVLERHAVFQEADHQRALDLLGDGVDVGRTEPHLRAVSALLVSLATYLEVTGRGAPRRSGDAPATANGTGATRAQQVGAPALNGVNGHGVNGRVINGHGAVAGALHEDRELAAAAASYIARDLAARQLSEFTSAEGYRLARALAKVGGVEGPVEQLLAQANRLRLHPTPLADAMSHSPH